MPYEVRLMTVPGTALLVVRRRAPQSQLSVVVPEACGVVWEYIRRAHVASPGRNVAVYLNGKIDLEVGVEVGGDAMGEGDVGLSATPAGLVVTTTHRGSYAGLSHAHQAVREWCEAQRRRASGPNWEVYGHWTDNLAELRTDVSYLLSAD